MNSSTEKYFIDQKTNRIYKETTISRTKIKNLNEEEVLELINNETIQIAVHSERNQLDWIEQEAINKLTESIKHHINHWEHQKEYAEFENGYCYFAELWKMKYGKKLILLYYRH